MIVIRSAAGGSERGEREECLPQNEPFHLELFLLSAREGDLGGIVPAVPSHGGDLGSGDEVAGHGPWPR